MIEKKQTNLVEAVEGMVDKNLDQVESQVDSAVDSAKGRCMDCGTKLRKPPAKAAVHLKGWLDRVQGSIEAQLTSRLWMVILIALAIRISVQSHAASISSQISCNVGKA